MFVRLQTLLTAFLLLFVGVSGAKFDTSPVGALTLGALAITLVIVSNAALVLYLGAIGGGTNVPPEQANKKRAVMTVLLVVPIKMAILFIAPAAVLFVERHHVLWFVAGLHSFVFVALIAHWVKAE